MQIALRLVSVDLKTIVQGRELVSIQMMETGMKLDMAPDPAPKDKRDSMSVKLDITNINILDLQASWFQLFSNSNIWSRIMLQACFPAQLPANNTKATVWCLHLNCKSLGKKIHHLKSALMLKEVWNCPCRKGNIKFLIVTFSVEYKTLHSPEF